MDWKPWIEEKIEEIKGIVGEERAVVACSGGVDSTTAALLAFEALGPSLYAVFLNDGLMRKQDYEQVQRSLSSLGLGVELLEVRERFFKSLRGIEDPEEKRKAFRETFYRTLGEYCKRKNARYLLQGTIKADIVETVGGVKTQHNVLEQVGIDPRIYGIEGIIEPLRELYKHEVRELARFLGLPKSVYQRQPFPGPGLATRIIGEVTPGRVEIVRKADEIVREEVERAYSHGKLGNLPFQYFAILAKDKATGVRNGKRLYGDMIIVRCVESVDAMTAKTSRIPYEVLSKIQERITQEIPTVARVLYDLTPKPPATIEVV
jgi:GMP synthase (glutamine-hydrolysing)